MGLTDTDFFDNYDYANTDEMIIGSGESYQYKYLPSFRFLLRVNLAYDVPLKAVRPFMKENEYEHIQEGGLNDYVHLRRKPVSKPFTLVVERYVTTDLDDPLANGTSLTLPLLLFIGRNLGMSMKNPVLNGRYYIFTGAVIMNKEYGGLDADKSGLLTETITIGYNSLYCVTNPVDLQSGGEAYNFDNGSTIDVTDPITGETRKISVGNTTLLHAQTKDIQQNKVTKDKMAEAAHLWSFDSDTPKSKNGKGDSSRQNRHEVLDGDGKPIKSRETGDNVVSGYGPLEPDKSQLIANAKQWAFAERKKDGNGIIRHQSGNGYIYDSDGNILLDEETQQPRVSGNAEQSLDDFIDASHRWNINETKEGTGTFSRANFMKLTNEDGSPVLDDEGNEVTSGYGAQEFKSDSAQWLGNSSRWEFNGKDMAGNGARHTKNAQLSVDAAGNPIMEDGVQVTTGVGPVEKRQADMIDDAHLWTMSSDANGKISTAGAASRANLTREGWSEEDGTALAGRKKKWSFDGNNKAGKGDTSRLNARSVKDPDGNETVSGQGVTEPDIDSMAGAAKQWSFTDKYTMNGNGVMSAVSHRGQNSMGASNKGTGVTELSETDMAKAGKEWEFDGSKKDGNGNRSRQNATKVTDGNGNSSISGQGTVELTMDQMSTGAAKWEFTDKYSKNGGGVKSRVDSPVDELTVSEMGDSAKGKKNFTNPAPTQPETRKWKFDGGTASHEGPVNDELSASAMASKAVKQTVSVSESVKPEARKWSIGDGGKMGEGTASHKNPPGIEESKASMMSKAMQGGAVKQDMGNPPKPRIWPPLRSAQTITDFLRS